MKTIRHDCKVVEAAAYASGTADVKAPLAGVDTKGYDTIEFVVHLGVIAAGAVTTAKLQQSDDTTDGNFADIAGSAVSIAADDDGEFKVLTIHKPRERYVRLYLDKDATNAVGASVTAFLHDAESSPVGQATVGGVLLVEPVEGTA